MKLTRENLHPNGYVHQGFNRHQIEALGLQYPPKKGWLTALIGTEISDEAYARFLELNGKTFKQRRKEAKAAKNVPQAAPNISSQHCNGSSQQFTGDRNLESVKAKMDERAKVGFAKYGVTTERTDIDLLGWLIHLQEEQMDSLIYIEAAIQDLRGKIAGRKLLNEIDPTDSAEDFANNLFEQTDRNLA